LNITSKIRNLYGPILLACLAFVGSFSAIIKARLASTSGLEFTVWDWSALGSATVALCVAIFYIVEDYRAKVKAAKFKRVCLKFSRTKSQPASLGTWSEDERFVSGVLNVSALIDNVEIMLFETVIRYGELTGASSPAEKLIERIISKEDWGFLKNTKSLLIKFEPTGDEGRVKTSSLYDREDLKDWVFEDGHKNPDLRQVLIYTRTMESNVNNYLKNYKEPDNVITVQTNHVPYKQELLPTLFNVVGEFVIDIEGLDSFYLSSNNIKLNHEYALGAVWSKEEGNYSKFLLEYAVSAEAAPKCY
jgi:hypothetical protein